MPIGVVVGEVGCFSAVTFCSFVDDVVCEVGGFVSAGIVVGTIVDTLESVEGMDSVGAGPASGGDVSGVVSGIVVCCDEAGALDLTFEGPLEAEPTLT